ncbi:chemotaxis protein CheW [Paraburkholderia jirisanensis]
MTERVVDQADAAARVDDCWKRIGTRGDQSCPELQRWFRCLNCPVFERAAAQLLDRPPMNEAAALPERGTSAVQAAAYQAEAATHDSGVAALTHSALVFRVADEWLALPTAALRHIEDLRPIHSLPHRRNRVVLGVVNVRGALTVAVSLRELLRLEAGSSTVQQQPARNGTYARMLVLTHRDEPVALPVDEVHGVLRYAAAQLKPVPDTLTRASAAHAQGIFAWRDTTVGLLDIERVFASLNQSLR